MTPPRDTLRDSFFEDIRLILAYAGERRFARTQWTDHRVQHWVLDSIAHGRQTQRVGDGDPFERTGGLLTLYAPRTPYFEREVAGQVVEEAYMVFSVSAHLESILRALTSPSGYCHIRDPESLVIVLLQRIARTARVGGVGANLQVTGLILQALGLLECSAFVTPGLRCLSTTADAARSLVTRVDQYLETHVEETVTVGDLASAMGMSESAFAHAYPRAAGETPYRAIMRCKMTAAKRMLLSDRLSIQETSARLGFSNAFNFSRAFKRFEGCAPSHYVARHML